MDEKDTIQSFGDMVEATERMSKPWQAAVHRLVVSLIITNALWTIIVGMLVWFAYMTPSEMSQEQDLTGQTQTQTYTEGAADGK